MAYQPRDPRTPDGAVFTDYRGRKYPGPPRAYATRLKSADADPGPVEPPALRALRGLDPFAEPLLHRRFVLGHSYHEIGRDEGCPASTILRRLQRRLRQLRREIEARLNDRDDGRR
jgi:DNA-directed RNA polymerase specialized sigma24 family protein